MPTEALYHTDSYLKEMDATVTAADGSRVALDRTVFYAQSGGQPSDQGTLSWDDGSARVVSVRREGEEIWHELDGPVPQVGATVHGALDWERRYALMKAHTALHVLCGVIWRDFGAKVTGGAMDVGSARMDFELEHMNASFAADVEQRINLEIEADRPVKVLFASREEAFSNPDLIRTKINLLPEGIQVVRLVEIEGVDLQADGGTHVARTGEVGTIRITGHESKGKINKRLRLALDV
ncbi:MAG: alanyl-tRNA editing protein [Chloroflexota bacterium]|nr:alanyl-tRNA editing protein [Chloroflexota bacterium]MDQ5866307.1 alanyl-tRNA editing protein [Chloroflexota bacterium]